MQFLPPLQTVPQLPQLLLSAAMLMQFEPHSFWPPAQMQAPPLQVAVAGQTVPQLPQLFESVAVVAQIAVGSVPHWV